MSYYVRQCGCFGLWIRKEIDMGSSCRTMFYKMSLQKDRYEKKEYKRKEKQ